MKHTLCIVLCLWAISVSAIAQNVNSRRINLSIGVSQEQPDSVRTHYVDVGLFSSTSHLEGFQWGVLSSIVDSRMVGCNVGGMLAYSGGKAKGLHLAGLANLALAQMKGVQLSGSVNVAHDLEGIQLAPYNFAGHLNGMQIGVINVARTHPVGWQVGLINITRDTVAHKMGLVNVNPKTRIDVMIYGGNTSKTNLALRFRNRSTYNMVGIGTHYLGLDEKFSGTLFYRIGQYFQLSPRWSVSGDVGYYHVESFQKQTNTRPKRLYSLQVRINLDYQINPTLGAFIGTGYGDTRYYGSHRRYHNGMILNGGLTLRYSRGR